MVKFSTDKHAQPNFVRDSCVYATFGLCDHNFKDSSRRGEENVIKISGTAVFKSIISVIIAVVIMLLRWIHTASFGYSPHSDLPFTFMAVALNLTDDEEQRWVHTASFGYSPHSDLPFTFMAVALNLTDDEEQRWVHTASLGYILYPDLSLTFMAVALNLAEVKSIHGASVSLCCYFHCWRWQWQCSW